ncbi:unnamed protein product [Didymodactylos carnosus]|uniref:Uncharacterized protein n=1 Tax=Didymodactylos carnosus TaxID=1234261 RepID=A0A814ZLS3_9BILA|nr:unnamed protein product [Didymodactylos carnosus]CAF1245554.1 unnamed protein product [Didymodactylos carnosus]CAF3829275.1 unnamed protein product [Didymodactylos carnosus]CAF4011342.1 unnamed protein product [Didymodactylos carnosus]
MYDGFTSVPWTAPPVNEMKSDPLAFLFTLTHTSHQAKCDFEEAKTAVWHKAEAGPIIGSNQDLYLDDQSNWINNNYINLSFAYIEKSDGTDRRTYSDFMPFTPEDIEVHKLL